MIAQPKSARSETENKRQSRRPGRPAGLAVSGEQFKEVILEAASQVYAERGYHGTSVQHIIKAAGVSRPTFYRYYSDRYEVLDVVIGRVNEGLRDLIGTAVAGTDDVELILERVVDAYFAWGDNIGAIAGPIYQEIHDPASPASAHRARNLSALLTLFTQRASEGLPVTAEPLLYEAAIQVVEHLGHVTFWPKKLPPEDSRRRKAVILQALRGMLLSKETS
jgi:AcrR family transcriptional regulator